MTPEALRERLRAKRHVSTLPGMDGMVGVSTELLDTALALLDTATPEPETKTAAHRHCEQRLEAALAENVTLKARRVEPRAPSPPPTCEWAEDGDGIWQTSCGGSWQFFDDGPTENKVTFCHRCGKTCVPVPYVESFDDDDEEPREEPQ